MTDIDLTPLPERFDCTNGNTPWCQGCYTMTPDEYGDYVQWEDYERIAAAQAAEIERLRAEVGAVWAAMPRDARYLDPPDGGCVPLHEQVRRMAADATRAERLEEALREKADKWDRIGDEHGVRQFTGNDHKLFANELRALLRDHDQEVGNE